MPSSLSNILSNKRLLVTIALGLVGAMVVGFLGLMIGVFVTFNNAQKEMVSQESKLSSLYPKNQNILSKCVGEVKESMGVAQSATAAQDLVLEDALKARYESDSSAQVGMGQAFSAIVEAYPDNSGVTDRYAEVMKVLKSCREEFSNVQTDLLEKLNEYATWKNSGLIGKHVKAMLGAPSDDLRAGIGDDVVRGQAAIDRMYKIVLTSGVDDAFESGEMDPMDLGPEDLADTTESEAPAE